MNNQQLEFGRPVSNFGLATFYDPKIKQAMTSRVVTLWYRPPELLLGATVYGVGIEFWRAGCILAELLVGKPIMPSRIEGTGAEGREMDKILEADANNMSQHSSSSVVALAIKGNKKSNCGTMCT